MNHEALLQSSDALHQHHCYYNENDNEQVSPLRHLSVHFVEYRLDVRRWYGVGAGHDV